MNNPAARLFKKRSGVAIEASANDESWTPQEIKKLLRAAKEPPFAYYFPMLVTMFAGALGQAECFGILFDKFNLKTGVCEIARDLIENEGHLSLGPLKTESRSRSFIVPAIALRILRERYKGKKPALSDYVFTTPDGSPIRRTNFGRRVWYPLIKKAKVRAIAPHKMRRNTGSFLIGKNKSPGLVHQVLGHSNYQTTAKHYVRANDASRRQVAATMDEFLKDL